MAHTPTRCAALMVAAAHAAAGCAWTSSAPSHQQEHSMTNHRATIDEAAALAVAKEDARQVYSDLGIYRVQAAFKDGNWHVDYELEGEAMAGGGPHYVISGSTGAILQRRYEQ